MNNELFRLEFIDINFSEKNIMPFIPFPLGRHQLSEISPYL